MPINNVTSLVPQIRPKVVKNANKDPSEMFLTMLTAQLKNQTPDNHVDTQAMCNSFVKLAQFQQQDALNKKLESANQQKLEIMQQHAQIQQQLLELQQQQLQQGMATQKMLSEIINKIA